MSDTVIAALLGGVGATVTALIGARRLELRKAREKAVEDRAVERSADRAQWDDERTRWMEMISVRLDTTETQLRTAQAALDHCEREKLAQDRVIALLRVDVDDLRRRVDRAGDLLSPHVDDDGELLPPNT